MELQIKYMKLCIKIEGSIIYEDIEKIIKRYPKMAIEKSIVLKLYYLMLLNEESKVSTYNLNINKNYYRGRLFEKDKSPYDNQEPFRELVQPPLEYARKSRFNEEGQSRFYITNRKIGAYFECRKYQKENKDLDLFVQEFKPIERDCENILRLKAYFDFGFYPSPETIYEYLNDKLNEYHLNNNYDISNYIADIVNATSKYKGISYNSAIFYSENNFLDYLKFRKENVYQNITFFSEIWDKEYYLKSLKSEFEKRYYETYFKEIEGLEGKDYFVPSKPYPTKLTPKQVILELFKEEYFKIENWRLNLRCGIDEIKYYFEFNFDKLFENMNVEIFGIDGILKINLSEDELKFDSDIENEQKFAEMFDSVNFRTKFYKDCFQDEFDKIEEVLKYKNTQDRIKIDFSNQNLIEIKKEDIHYLFKNDIENFAFEFSSKIINGKYYLKVEKVRLSKKTKKDIITEVVKFFDRFFGIYYKILIDYERDSIMLVEM